MLDFLRWSSQTVSGLRHHTVDSKTCLAPSHKSSKCALVLQEMSRSGSASSRCIVNISSTSGTHGNAGQVNYATAKAGVVGLTKSIAKEW